MAIRKPFRVEGRLVVSDSATIAGLVYPTVDGTNGQVLTTDGDGRLSFTTVSGGGATNLADLGDVLLDGLEAGGLLQYDSALQKWTVSNDITEDNQDITTDGGFY